MSYTKTWDRQTKIDFVESVFSLFRWGKIDLRYEDVIRVILTQTRDTFRELIDEWEKERRDAERVSKEK